eukprot:3459750-Alexandrium_andersonii.AAC.1
MLGFPADGAAQGRSRAAGRRQGMRGSQGLRLSLCGWVGLGLGCSGDVDLPIREGEAAHGRGLPGQAGCRWGGPLSLIHI